MAYVSTALFGCAAICALVDYLAPIMTSPYAAIAAALVR